jgi:HD-like signal output (HDOD) protein
MLERHVILVETQGEALRRHVPALRACRPEWHLVQVGEPEAATELVGRLPVAVVVASFGSDPEACRGFLERARGCDPASFRIAVLASDPSRDRDTPPLGLSGIAHQCLGPSFPASQLRRAIERGLAAWAWAKARPGLAEFIADLEDLPTPPSVYLEIAEVLESPGGSMASVARTLERDPGLAAKVLKVANSGLFAFPRPIADLQEAVVLLGTDLVQALVLSARLYGWLPLPGLKLERLWRHCAAVGALAREISLRLDRDRRLANASGVAGLLHDVGQLILMSKAPERYFSLIRQASGDEATLLGLEQAEYGVGHPDLGAYLLALWGLPESILDAVAYHHGWDDTGIQSIPLPLKCVLGAEWVLGHRRSQVGAPSLSADWSPGGAPDSARLREWRDTVLEMVDPALIRRVAG